MIKDIKQAVIGSFLAIIVFFALRGNNPFFFNPSYGLIISFFIVYIYYQGFNGKYKKENFFIDLVIIGWWIAIPSALLFDKFNFTNPLKRYYVRR